MADPPSYEDSTSDCTDRTESKGNSKVPQRFSVREEVDVSRSQHVSALVSRLLPQVRDRAQRGLSKSTMLLLPTNQESGRNGELVGFPEDEMPIIIQLEGRIDTTEFWMQQEAVSQLQSQMLGAISNDLPLPAEEPLPLQNVVSSKGSFLSRKQAKAVASRSNRVVEKPLVRVEARFDEIYFRLENAFGLYETHRSKCVMLVIDAR